MIFKKHAVRLIPFQHKHVRMTFRWVRDPALQRSFFIRGTINWKGHQAYFKKVLSSALWRVYAIIVDRRHVGNCGFKHIIPDEKMGELWIYIGDRLFRGKGIGQIATQLLLQEGFETLGLERIYLHVAKNNIAAQKLYKKFGFRKVRLLKQDSEWSNRDCKIIRMQLKK